MSSVFRKSAAALLAALFLLSALSGCFKIHKIDGPASPDPAETLADPASDPAESPDGISVGSKPGKTDANEPAEPAPEPEPEPEPVSLNYELLEDAIAIGLIGNGAEYLHDENGLWHVIGIYAALLARIGDRQMGAWLSDRECDALSAILLPDEDPPGIPDAWFSDGGVVREDMNGTPGISFPSYETYLGSMLGIWREVRHPEDEDAPYAVEVIDHLDDGVWHTFFYIAIAEDPADGQNKLASLVIGDSMLEASSLPFNLNDVREQNRIASLLRSYEAVTIRTDDTYGTDTQVFWLRDGDTVYYEVSEISFDDEGGEPMVFHSENGAYRDLEFNTYLMAEPMISVWVTANKRDPGDVRDYYDNLLVRYIPEDPASELTLVSEDDETFTFTADGPYYENDDGVGGMCTTTFTVAKDTLAILSCSWAYENGYIGGAFTVTYNGEKAGEDVMKAWDRTRRLDIDIRTEAGEPRVDSVEIPDSWLVQLLADELITVYFDEACTEPTYNLLDAGGDLTLWARDEANTPLTPAPGGTDLPADLPGFAVEDIIDANYLTVLLPQYGQVKINQTYDYGSDYVCYFPFRDTVAYYGEGRYVFDGEDENTRFGSDGDISYDIAEDGTVSGYAYADTASGEDYIAYNSDAEGRFFPDNAYLSSSLYGCVITDIEERDDAFVIHTGYAETAEGEDPVVQTYTVDRETLAIRSYAVEGADYSLTVEYGEGLNPYEDAFRTAMADTRTVTYHIRMDGETFDRVYEVPKSWTFSLRVKEDMRFFKDKGLTDPTENLVPADQWNHEIWVTDARG